MTHFHENTVPPGRYWQPVRIEDDEMASPVPCCARTAYVPLDKVRLLGTVTVHCQADSRTWRFWYDPWGSPAPRAKALWVDG